MALDVIIMAVAEPEGTAKPGACCIRGQVCKVLWRKRCGDLVARGEIGAYRASKT